MEIDSPAFLARERDKKDPRDQRDCVKAHLMGVAEPVLSVLWVLFVLSPAPAVKDHGPYTPLSFDGTLTEHCCTVAFPPDTAMDTAPLRKS